MTQQKTTDWFDINRFEPGQPGVYEFKVKFVNEPRYSMWNGTKWLQYAPTPSTAAESFDQSTAVTLGYVTHFRGLKEEV